MKLRSRVSTRRLKRVSVLASNFSGPEFPEFDPTPSPIGFDLDEDRSPGLSLPIILFSAACGLGLGIIVLYLTYRMLLLGLPMSAGIATLVVLGTLSVTGGGLSALTRSNPVANIVASCGLIVLAVLFFGFCSLVGALAAALLLNL